MAAELVKLLAQHGRNAKKGRRKLKAVKPNRRAELNYASELLTLTSFIRQQTKEILLPVLKELEVDYGYTRDGYAEKITEALTRLGKIVGTNTNTKARYMAATETSSTTRFVARRI